MRFLAIGAHLLRDDIEPLTEAVPMGDLFLSATPMGDDQPLADRDLMMRVAGLRAKLLEVATYIAVRYGFTFGSAEEAQSKTLEHHARWKRVLTACRGEVEMTLKVVARGGQGRPDRHSFASGAEYLRALHEATQRASVDPGFRDAVDRLIVPLTTRHRWIHRDSRSLEMVMLVERARVDELRAAGEELRATDVPFLLSGPWPLESYADDDRQ